MTNKGFPSSPTRLLGYSWGLISFLIIKRVRSYRDVVAQRSCAVHVWATRRDQSWSLLDIRDIGSNALNDNGKYYASRIAVLWQCRPCSCHSSSTDLSGAAIRLHGVLVCRPRNVNQVFSESLHIVWMPECNALAIYGARSIKIQLLFLTNWGAHTRLPHCSEALVVFLEYWNSHYSDKVCDQAAPE